MNQTFKITRQVLFGECTKTCQTANFAFNKLPDFEIFHALIPGVFQQLTTRQADPTAVTVDSNHLYFDFIAHFENFTGVFKAVPGHFTEMNKPIYTTNVDERAKISQASETPFADIADILIFQYLIADHIAGFVACGTFTQNQTLALTIDLNDTNIDAFTDELFKFFFRGSTADV